MSQMVKSSFFFYEDIPVCVCVCVCILHFLYPFITGYLGCLCVLVLVNNATVNMGMRISFQISVFVFFG